MPSRKKLGIIFISIWRLFIWDTLEIKYQMMNSRGKWFDYLFSCPNVDSKIWRILNAESKKIGYHFYFHLTSFYLGYIGDQVPNDTLGGQMI